MCHHPVPYFSVYRSWTLFWQLPFAEPYFDLASSGFTNFIHWDFIQQPYFVPLQASQKVFKPPSSPFLFYVIFFLPIPIPIPIPFRSHPITSSSLLVFAIFLLLFLPLPLSDIYFSSLYLFVFFFISLIICLFSLYFLSLYPISLYPELFDKA